VEGGPGSGAQSSQPEAAEVVCGDKGERSQSRKGWGNVTSSLGRGRGGKEEKSQGQRGGMGRAPEGGGRRDGESTRFRK